MERDRSRSRECFARQVLGRWRLGGGFFGWAFSVDGFPAARVERELGSRDGRAAPGANGSVGLEVRPVCRILFSSGEQFVEKSHE